MGEREVYRKAYRTRRIFSDNNASTAPSHFLFEWRYQLRLSLPSSNFYVQTYLPGPMRSKGERVRLATGILWLPFRRGVFPPQGLRPMHSLQMKRASLLQKEKGQAQLFQRPQRQLQWFDVSYLL